MEIEEKSLEEYKISHAKTFVEQGLASNFDGSLDSLMPQVIRYGSDNEVTPIMIGTLAMRQFAQLVVKELEPVFGICHTYDIGDQTVYFEVDEFDKSVIDLAVYLHFKAEEIIDEVVCVSNQTTAKFLELFGGKRRDKKPNTNVIKLDMYIEREYRCSEWYTTEFINLDSKYSEMTEAFIKKQNALDSDAFAC